MLTPTVPPCQEKPSNYLPVSPQKGPVASHASTAAPFPVLQTTSLRQTPADISSTTQAAIGSVTGSEAWKASGEQAKAHGVSDMKAASEGRDASSQGYGKAEELAGKAVGCEGMVKEGDASGKKE